MQKDPRKHNSQTRVNLFLDKDLNYLFTRPWKWWRARANAQKGTKNQETY